MIYTHIAALDAVLPASDRVYQAPDGRHYKARVLRAAPPPGAPAFGMGVIEVSASVCDSAGWAIEHGEGYAIAPAQRHTIDAETAVDVEAWIELKRIAALDECAKRASLEAALSAADMTVAP